MKFEIKDRWKGKVLYADEAESLKALFEAAVKSGANLSGADLYRANLYRAILSWADLSGAILSGANLSGADLSGANLSGADLSWADLSGANLSGANLYRANLYRAILSGADLSGADLSGATGAHKDMITPLRILLDQPGKIRAYKLVTKEGTGPTYPSITYKVGKSYKEPKANKDENTHCAEGINLATLDWCMKEWREGYEIFLAEFEASDIAAIPIATDGKFRVSACTIVGKKDLKELGLVKDEVKA